MHRVPRLVQLLIATLVVVAVTAAPALAGTQPPFEASIERLDAATRAEMTGVSWHRGCPVPLRELRVIHMTFWGFDREAHTGRAGRAPAVGRRPRARLPADLPRRFPIRRMQAIERYDGNDHRSMRADNTSAFNCRYVAGTTRWSQHAYGRAIDLNPVENPYVSGHHVSPRAGEAVRRSFVAAPRHGPPRRRRVAGLPPARLGLGRLVVGRPGLPALLGDGDLTARPASGSRGGRADPEVLRDRRLPQLPDEAVVPEVQDAHGVHRRSGTRVRGSPRGRRTRTPGSRRTNTANEAHRARTVAHEPARATACPASVPRTAVRRSCRRRSCTRSRARPRTRRTRPAGRTRSAAISASDEAWYSHFAGFASARCARSWRTSNAQHDGERQPSAGITSHSAYGRTRREVGDGGGVPVVEHHAAERGERLRRAAGDEERRHHARVQHRPVQPRRAVAGLAAVDAGQPVPLLQRVDRVPDRGDRHDDPQVERAPRRRSGRPRRAGST